jgi:NAD(P)-dependent dehydrogenase (short-subunit alcohol dehydrogenase family)
VSSWTIRDIPDLSGRTAVVTGANSGLGLQVSIELARHGAHVVLACRDRARGASALNQVVGSAELVLLDLADLAAVRTAAAEIGRAHGRLDLLVCNAGVMATPYRTTADGFELQFGTNHLGHFALTGLLMARLLAGPGARVVVVSSNVHRLGRMSPDDLGLDRRYQKWFAYGRSKLANLLFMNELQRRAVAAGVDLTSVGAHPGWAVASGRPSPRSATACSGSPRRWGRCHYCAPPPTPTSRRPITTDPGGWAASTVLPNAPR